MKHPLRARGKGVSYVPVMCCMLRCLVGGATPRRMQPAGQPAHRLMDTAKSSPQGRASYGPQVIRVWRYNTSLGHSQGVGHISHKSRVRERRQQTSACSLGLKLTKQTNRTPGRQIPVSFSSITRLLYGAVPPVQAQASRPLKNVGEAAEARQKQAKKRSLRVVNEHFEPVFNDASATQVVFQRPARQARTCRPRLSLPKAFLLFLTGFSSVRTRSRCFQ